VFKDEKLTNKKTLYKASPNSNKGQHFGSRIAFDNKDYLYFSVGDRGNRGENSQDIMKDCDKIYRLHDDGSIPDDNPFIDVAGAKKAIYSYGHRNPQGMEMNPLQMKSGRTNTDREVEMKSISSKQEKTMVGQKLVMELIIVVQSLPIKQR